MGLELFSLRGRVAVVTGGASGIGLATVRMLAAAGAAVVLVGLPEQEPERIAERLCEEGGLAVEGFACDVTDDDGLARLIDAVRLRHGRLDAVVCSAGAALDRGPHAVGTDNELDRMFDLHVRSVLHLARLALPLLAEGGGAFVVVSSIAGLRGNRLIGGYGVTKAAGAQLVRNLAVQWGDRGVRVNAVSPGVIDTGFATPITGDAGVAARRLERTPLRRFGTAEEVAAAVLWLAAPSGAFVTGQNIVIDGGTLIAD
jgi:NAD(P)-dependent dehydrogenase (short-subunit alcohol dehydrogenase family)